MRYVRSVETSKRVAVEAARLNSGKVGHVLASLAKTASDGAGCKSLKTNGGAEGGRTPDLRIANAALCQTELLPHKGCHIRKHG